MQFASHAALLFVTQGEQPVRDAPQTFLHLQSVGDIFSDSGYTYNTPVGIVKRKAASVEITEHAVRARITNVMLERDAIFNRFAEIIARFGGVLRREMALNLA